MDTYTFRADFTNVVPLGITVAGIRLDVAFTGEVTEGFLKGAIVEGTDFFLLRPDGIGVIDVRERFTRGGVALATCHRVGYVVPDEPFTDLARVASPDFQWPDMDLPAHGAAFLETTDDRIPRAAYTVYGLTGTVNVARGTARIAARSLDVDR